MHEFLQDYSLFLAKTLTIVFAVGATMLLAAFLGRRRGHREGTLEISKINAKYDSYRDTLQAHILHKDQLKLLRKRHKAEAKVHETSDQASPHPRKRIFVLGFEGDLQASAAAALANEVTAVLTVATPEDEIFVKVHSAGGLVHGYGLAASQLRRIRERNISLTASVDKIAASGGYMLACVANRIVAAPFSIIGSIGVVAQLPNFHRFLQKHDVDFELLTAGKYKRTLTVFGENTDAARDKFREDLEATHGLFKQFVADHRPQLDLDRVSTGEYWHGKDAFTLGLVDVLGTSEDYLQEACATCDVYEIHYREKTSFGKRFSKFVAQGAQRLAGGIYARAVD